MYSHTYAQDIHVDSVPAIICSVTELSTDTSVAFLNLWDPDFQFFDSEIKKLETPDGGPTTGTTGVDRRPSLWQDSTV